jgi:hypothetical protein
MPLTPEQQARLNELRSKQQGTLSPDQEYRLRGLRMKSAGNTVPDFAIPEGEHEFDTGAVGGFGAPAPARMPIPQDEAMEWQTISKPVIEHELGGPFDFGKELQDFGTRFDLARSTNPEEMKMKLQDKYPNAEVKLLSGFGDEPVPVIRRQGEPVYHAVDAHGVTGSDLADVFGAMLTPDMATSIATAIATRGMGMLPKVLAQGVAGAGGDLVNSGIEAARGYQTDPFNELLMQAGATGLLNMSGEYIGSKYSRPKAGIMNVPPGVQNVEAAQAAENLAPLTAGDYHPLTKMKEQQVATTNQAMREAQKQKYRSMGDKLAEGAEGYVPDDLEIDDMQLDELIQTQVKTLRDLTAGDPVEMRQGAKALRQGIDDFRGTSKKWSNARYARARELSEGATFDISEAQKYADKISGGVQAKGKDKIMKETSALVDEQGNEIVREVIEKGKPVKVSSTPEGGYADLLRRLKNIDPEVGDFKGENAIDILKTLRSEFGDYARFGPDNPLPDSQQAQARKIYQMLSDAMDNPSGGSDDFVRAWRSAQEGHKFRRKVLDAASIKELATSDNVYEMGRKFARPGQFENLQLLKRTIGKKQWKKYRQAVKTDVYRDQNPLAVIDEWEKDPDGFNLLFTPAEKREMRAYAYSLDKIKSGPIMQALKSQKNNGKRVLGLIKSGDKNAIKTIIKEAGGPTSQKARSIRAGIFENILDQSSVLKEGEYLPDPQKLIDVIEEYERTGMLKEVLLPADIETLGNLKIYASGVKRGSDVGASLVGAEITSQFFDIFRPDRSLKGLTAVGRHAVLGNAFTYTPANKVIWGTGVRGEPRLTIRGLVLGLSNLAGQQGMKGQTGLEEVGPLDRVRVEDDEK